MKLYKLSQKASKGIEWETFRTIFVCANDPIDAKSISPTGCEVTEYNAYSDDWADIEDIECEYLGEAAAHIERGVIFTDYLG